MREENTAALYPLEFAPRLMEEAVLLGMRRHPEQKEFHRLRDAIYEQSSEEKREKAFEQLHRAWFVKLDLGRYIATALSERPAVMRDTRGCRILLALRAKDEGADLHGPTPKNIVLMLRATSLLDTGWLLPFLRHEFLHLADMLDPCFGYQPHLPEPQEAIYENLHRERYRVLWDVWIDGRLARQGLAAEGIREIRKEEFHRTFPMLGDEREQLFTRWFDASIQTHSSLATFALDPKSTRQPSQQSASQGRCPICRFPSFDLWDGADLTDEVLEEIALDFPDWRKEEGLCRQCADLYGSRGMSRAAELTLPHS